MVLNKWDLIKKETQSHREFHERVFRKLDFVSYAPLVFISALSGQRIVKILDLSEEVFASGERKLVIRNP